MSCPFLFFKKDYLLTTPFKHLFPPAMLYVISLIIQVAETELRTERRNLAPDKKAGLFKFIYKEMKEMEPQDKTKEQMKGKAIRLIKLAS